MGTRRYTIKELPPELRPRERLLSEGAEALSSAELLGILFGTGSKETTAIELAGQVPWLLLFFMSLFTKCVEGNFLELRRYGSKKFAPSVDCWHHIYRWKATAHSVYEREEGENAMQLEGITWHALTLQADQFGPTKKLLIEVFGLRPAIDTDGYARFPMSNGTILELYSPAAIPAYGFNEGGIVFGFRVEDIEAASEELAEAGCELLGEITRIEEKNYAYRDFRGPDGRVYGINEQK